MHLVCADEIRYVGNSSVQYKQRATEDTEPLDRATEAITVKFKGAAIEPLDRATEDTERLDRATENTYTNDIMYNYVRT